MLFRVARDTDRECTDNSVAVIIEDSPVPRSQFLSSGHLESRRYRIRLLCLKMGALGIREGLGSPAAEPPSRQIRKQCCLSAPASSSASQRGLNFGPLFFFFLGAAAGPFFSPKKCFFLRASGPLAGRWSQENCMSATSFPK